MTYWEILRNPPLISTGALTSVNHTAIMAGHTHENKPSFNELKLPNIQSKHSTQPFQIDGGVDGSARRRSKHHAPE